MSKTKKSLIIAFVSVMLLGLYNLIVLLCFKEKTANFWISYGFITGFFLLTVLSIYIYTVGKFAGKIVDISVPALSGLALGIDLIIGTIFMFFPGLMFNIVFLPQIILLVLLLIAYVPAILGNNKIGAGRKAKVNGKRTYQYEQRNIDDENDQGE